MYDNLLQIYSNNDYLKNNTNNTNIFVLDLDETIGHFTDLYILWIGITRFLNISNNINFQYLFNDILDLYPEFFRSDIFKIIKFLVKQKKNKVIKAIYIYTNNQCLDDKWINYITNYINIKVNFFNVFDKIIYAFKINNKIVELHRTSKKKNINDLINCTFIPNNSNICFIDNLLHQEMISDNVYYILPHSYKHSLNEKDILDRIISSDIGKYISINSSIKNDYFKSLIDWYFLNKSYDNKQYQNNTDYINISKKILYHIKNFIFIINRKPKTRKNNKHFNNFTRKNKN